MTQNLFPFQYEVKQGEAGMTSPGAVFSTVIFGAKRQLQGFPSPPQEKAWEKTNLSDK